MALHILVLGFSGAPRALCDLAPGAFPNLLPDSFLFRGLGDSVVFVRGLRCSSSSSSSKSSSLSSSELSLYDILCFVRPRRVRPSFMGALRTEEVALCCCLDEDCSASVERCRADRRVGMARFLLETLSASESDKSSSLLGSLYETAPRLRLSVMAIGPRRV